MTDLLLMQLSMYRYVLTREIKYHIHVLIDLLANFSGIAFCVSSFCQPQYLLRVDLNPSKTRNPLKVGLGISRTNADSQWNPVYNVFHRNFGCGNETIRR